MEPASIRYKNPGAMWGRRGKRTTIGPVDKTDAPIPLRWGSTETIYLNDGLGQGNNIAVFNTWADGICAQLDLWRSSPNYRNKQFKDAIRVWAGGNNVASYIAYVLARVPGMRAETVMNDEFWKGPMGVAFLKAQAGHEAGKLYPAPAADWLDAQRRVFKAANAGKTAGAVIATGTAAATAGHFLSGPMVAAAIFSIGAVAALVLWLKHRK